MKKAYPIIIAKGQKYLVVYIPDFNINTQGKDIPEAMSMARDAIGIMGIDMEDEDEPLPEPSSIDDVLKKVTGSLVTLVDVDFDEYRRKQKLRTVRRNVSLPYWLNSAAEKAGINVSAVLQAALKKELSDRPY